jgi:hypothetical protein
MSSQADMNKLADKITLEQRLKRIESQMQVQKALASGKGVNIRGASAGAQLGTGYGATYQGKKSIVIKGGAIELFHRNRRQRNYSCRTKIFCNEERQ